MKFTNLKNAVLLALAGTTLLATTASAVNDYDAGDLLLGVRADAGTGVTQDLHHCKNERHGHGV
ncbi:MAG: hypothetical protein K8R87_00390 [Verrucomicrobia bacterium]|nr:hypothetical protein [Verrucomicrobiota bacterium]